MHIDRYLQPYFVDIPKDLETILPNITRNADIIPLNAIAESWTGTTIHIYRVNLQIRI